MTAPPEGAVQPKPRRPVLGAVVAVAVFSAGVWVVGGTQVRALVRSAVATPGIEPLPGSHAGPSRSIVFDGSPARVRRCVAPPGSTVASVRDHYDALAARESACGAGRTLPHATVDQGEVAFVLWTSPRDGRRKGVIVTSEIGAVRYTLIDGEPLQGGSAVRPSSDRALVLPGGIVAPEGSRPGLALEEGSTGYACFEAPGSSDAVASELRSSLERAHFALDAKVQDELEATSAGSRVVISFTNGTQKGFFVVAPEKPGESRVTLAIR